MAASARRRLKSHSGPNWNNWRERAPFPINLIIRLLYGERNAISSGCGRFSPAVCHVLFYCSLFPWRRDGNNKSSGANHRFDVFARVLRRADQNDAQKRRATLFDGRINNLPLALKTALNEWTGEKPGRKQNPLFSCRGQRAKFSFCVSVKLVASVASCCFLLLSRRFLSCFQSAFLALISQSASALFPLNMALLIYDAAQLAHRLELRICHDFFIEKEIVLNFWMQEYAIVMMPISGHV